MEFSIQDSALILHVFWQAARYADVDVEQDSYSTVRMIETHSATLRP